MPHNREQLEAAATSDSGTGKFRADRSMAQGRPSPAGRAFPDGHGTVQTRNPANSARRVRNGVTIQGQPRELDGHHFRCHNLFNFRVAAAWPLAGPAHHSDFPFSQRAYLRLRAALLALPPAAVNLLSHAPVWRPSSELCNFL